MLMSRKQLKAGQSKTSKLSGGARTAYSEGVPNTESGTVRPPRATPHGNKRPREYLTPGEVAELMTVAKRRSRHGLRDAAMILVAYRHGLRGAELCALRWEQVDLAAAQLHVTRLKGGVSGVHPLWSAEQRALRKLKRGAVSPYVFLSERGAPISPAGFRKMLARIGQASSLPFPVHPHMLRHACGFKLANDGQDTRVIQQYLGHRNIQNTVRYTDLASARFNRLWDD